MRTNSFLLALSAMSLAFGKPSWPKTDRGHFEISNFAFDSGETLKRLDLHYQTLGELETYPDGTTNAVLIMHGSTGESAQMLVDEFAGVLFNPGQILDAKKYFIILPDAIGHGKSSKPSDQLRAKFPSYQYSDMVNAHHTLLTQHLGVNHTRLIMGVSMGGMHSWLMGERYPNFMDALMPIACQPAEISGQNRLWRKFIIELITGDPARKNGNYKTQPMTSLSGALSIVQTMFTAPVSFYRDYPTREAVDEYVDELLPHVKDYDANDQLYAWNASNTYNPEPQLGKIKVPLTAVNTADDMMNPPELRILEDAVEHKMKPNIGKAVIVPRSKKTEGHGSYIKAELWKDELELLLSKTSNGKC